MGTYSAPCPHCQHDKSLFTAVWNTAQEKGFRIWHTYLTCTHCNLGIGAIFSTTGVPNNLGPANWPGDILENFNLAASWPKLELPRAPQQTPPAVAKRFLEGEDAFARRKWNSAVSMYRSALDIATKGMDGVPKLTFYERLRWMHEKGRLTADIREWADTVRVEGNDALHEPEEFTEADAKALRYFTEMFLRYVFELPGLVREFRSETGQDKKP